MITTQATPEILLYQAAFDRQPDVPGLAFNEGLIDSGKETLSQLGQQFASSPEFQSVHAGQDTAQIVTSIYENVLNRGPDAAGLAYWTQYGNALGHTVGDLLAAFATSTEAIEVNGIGVQKLISSQTTDPSQPLDNSIPTTTITLPGQPYPVTTPGQPYPVNVPVPTAEPHVIAVSANGALEPILEKPDGTFDSGNGTSGASGWTNLVDQTSGLDFSFRSHPRQSGMSDTGTVTQTGNNVVVDYNVHAGTQNNDAGASATHADASLDFGVGSVDLAKSLTQYEVDATFTTQTATKNTTLTLKLVANANGTTNWVTKGDAGIPDGTVYIGDDNPSVTHAANSTNIGFGNFDGQANAEPGTYSMTLTETALTGVAAGQVQASLTAHLHATSPLAA